MQCPARVNTAHSSGPPLKLGEMSGGGGGGGEGGTGDILHTSDCLSSSGRPEQDGQNNVHIKARPPPAGVLLCLLIDCGF